MDDAAANGEALIPLPTDYELHYRLARAAGHLNTAESDARMAVQLGRLSTHARALYDAAGRRKPRRQRRRAMADPLSVYNPEAAKAAEQPAPRQWTWDEWQSETARSPTTTSTAAAPAAATPSPSPAAAAAAAAASPGDWSAGQSPTAAIATTGGGAGASPGQPRSDGRAPRRVKTVTDEMILASALVRQRLADPESGVAVPEGDASAYAAALGAELGRPRVGEVDPDRLMQTVAARLNGIDLDAPQCRGTHRPQSLVISPHETDDDEDDEDDGHGRDGGGGGGGAATAANDGRSIGAALSDSAPGLLENWHPAPQSSSVGPVVGRANRSVPAHLRIERSSSASARQGFRWLNAHTLGDESARRSDSATAPRRYRAHRSLGGGGGGGGGGRGGDSSSSDLALGPVQPGP